MGKEITDLLFELSFHLDFVIGWERFAENSKLRISALAQNGNLTPSQFKREVVRDLAGETLIGLYNVGLICAAYTAWYYSLPINQ